MDKENYEVIITLHEGSSHKLFYQDTRENIEDIVSKLWYTGFLETNPANPKRKIHILPERIENIRFKKIEEPV